MPSNSWEHKRSTRTHVIELERRTGRCRTSKRKEKPTLYHKDDLVENIEKESNGMNAL